MAVMPEHPLDYEPQIRPIDRPKRGIVSFIVTIVACCGLLAGISAFAGDSWFMGGANVAVWGAILLHQYRVYDR